MFRTRSVYSFVLFSIGVGFAQAPASITLTPSAVSISAGKSVTFQSTISRRAEAASNRVTFFDRATILGTALANGQGEASFSTAWLSAGRHEIYAVAGGARSRAAEITIDRVASSSFGTAKHYAAGLTPNAMAIADFNGNGQLDIALAGASGISVLLGHADGTFGDPLRTAAAFQPTAMAAGDFDGDGVMDLAAADGTTGKIYILRGAGDGTFSAPRVVATGINPVALAIADFNGDGVADLAVADQVGNSVLILLGRGDGSFAAPARIPAGVQPAALAVGDFNADGMADLAVADFSGNDVTILLGKGDGTFTPSASLKVGNGPAAILMSDLNGDGIEDLAVLNRLDATATVFYGKGDGTFQSGISLPAGSTPIGIAASDPDNNGFRALLVADGGKLRWQQLTASSARPAVQIDAGGVANGIAVGDFTGDGRSGVVIADQDGVVWHPRAAGSAFSVKILGCPATVSSGQSFSCTVGAYDVDTDPAEDFSDTVHFTSSDGSATLPVNTTIPNPRSFNFTLQTLGSQTLTAADIDHVLSGGAIGASVTVQAPVASHFSVSAPRSINAGIQFTVTVTALDPYGNIATGYSGTVQITSSDIHAELPLNSTLLNGVGAFLVILETARSQTVSATDVSTSITGTSGAVAVGSGYPGIAHIVAGTNQSAVVGTAFSTPLEITVFDFYGNPSNGTTVTYRVPSSGASALLSSSTAVTNASGIASVTATANVVPGNFVVMFRVMVPTLTSPKLRPMGGAPQATFLLTNLANVTVQTSPPGLAFTVDGTSYNSSQSFGFALNSSHTIAVPELQTGPGELQYGFSNWSDSGAASHAIIATGRLVTYTATVGIVYQLTTSASPAAGGTVLPASGKLYNAGATVPLEATPTSGYRFDHWNGVVNASKNATTSIVMNGPESVTAVFVLKPQVSPEALNLLYNQGADPSTASGSLSVTTIDASTFSVVAAGAWLIVPSSPMATPATVTVKVNVSGMNPGIYNSSLMFSFNDGSTLVIPVTLTVSGVPQLLWTGTPSGPLNFTVQSGASTVESRAIIVSAAGQNIPLQVAASASSPQAGQWLSLSPDGNSNGTTPRAFHVQVNPSGLAAGVYQGTITATSSTAGVSPLNIPVTLTLTAAPQAISVGVIQNAASFRVGSEAPNTILTAFGLYPGCTSGAQVSVDGGPTAVFYSSPTQVNFLFPASVSGEEWASVQIQCGGLKSAVIQVPVLNLAPAIFTVGQNGTGQAAIVNQDGSLATAAPPGSDIQIFGTGFGMLEPAGSDGLRHLALPVTATIGGIPATVLFAGEAPGTTPGLQQINVQIPANAPPGPAVTLQLTVGGASTPVGVTLAIQ